MRRFAGWSALALVQSLRLAVLLGRIRAANDNGRIEWATHS